MKNLILILILIPFISYTQSDVPEKYWITDKEFENKIAQVSSFGENNFETIIIEFWAEFNKKNCFSDWNKIKNAKYYRVNYKRF